MEGRQLDGQGPERARLGLRCSLFIEVASRIGPHLIDSVDLIVFRLSRLRDSFRRTSWTSAALRTLPRDVLAIII